MPRNPETHAQLEDVLEAESALPVDQWVSELADAAEPHDYKCPGYKKKSRARNSVSGEYRAGLEPHLGRNMRSE